MAEEIKKIITVDVSGAVSSLSEMREETESAGYSFKSLGDAKKYIDKLRASLIDLEEGSSEYIDTVSEINKVQQKLNEAMKASDTTVKNAEGSYNALSKQMSELKKAWKETSDEAERESIGKQIVSINDKLKEFDASIGNYQRNVGNYEGAFTKGIGEISKQITSLGNPLAIAKNGVMALGKAFKALIANPVGAVIMAIVAAVKLLKKGFEGSEEATNSLKRAFAALQPVMDAISNVMTGFAKIVGKVAETAIPALVNALQKAATWMLELLNKLGIVSDERLESFKKSIELQKEAVKVTQDLTEREIALVEKKRKLQVDEAKKELEISELRAKAADKEKYSAEQRQKYLEQAIALERNLNNQKLAVAQEEYNIALERSKLTDNDAATNDALAAAQANLYNVKRDYYSKERELITQLNEAKKQQTTENEKENKKQLDDEKKKAEELAKIKEKELEKIKEIQERVSLSLMDASDRDIAILTKKYEEEKALLEKYGEDTVKLTEEYQKNVAKVKVDEGEGKLKDVDEEATLQQYIADKTVQIEFDKRMKLLDIEQGRLEDKRAIYEELLNIDNLSVEQKEEYKNKMAEIDAALIENSNNRKELEKANAIETVNTYSSMAAGIGDLMGTIADIWQDSIRQRQKNGEITEEQAKEEFEQTKKLQIASAVINGLAGVATAVATAMTLGPIIGPIMAGINSALVIATTAAQIAKIKQTTYDSGSSGGGSVSSSTPTTVAAAYSPNYSTNVTGQSETTDLANAVKEGQSDTKVYVLESDINEAGKKVSVRENESTF